MCFIGCFILLRSYLDKKATQMKIITLILAKQFQSICQRQQWNQMQISIYYWEPISLVSWIYLIAYQVLLSCRVQIIRALSACYIIFASDVLLRSSALFVASARLWSFTVICLGAAMTSFLLFRATINWKSLVSQKLCVVKLVILLFSFVFIL